MGCFSFMCKKTGKPALSTSFEGSPVHMFLLKDGEVIEHMYGNYDSYGRVFSDKKELDDHSFTPYTSFEWDVEWGDVCDLMFHPDKGNGIAVIHADHWKEGDPYPTERSDDDPNQGWGYTKNSNFSIVKNPYHKVLKHVTV
jgi:hypothetical protein